jgi:hypothetical protein
MPTIINHSKYDMSSGTRVLLLKGRHKDGLTRQRTITRVTHNEEQWEEAFDVLMTIMENGERIYGTAGQRDVKKAARKFKERQLAAEYDQDPLAFYRKMDFRWASCLMDESCQADKKWLFDCDNADHVVRVSTFLTDNNIPFYEYDTKNGLHCITSPFNRSKLPDGLDQVLHTNALSLLVY